MRAVTASSLGLWTSPSSASMTGRSGTRPVPTVAVSVEQAIESAPKSKIAAREMDEMERFVVAWQLRAGWETDDQAESPSLGIL